MAPTSWNGSVTIYYKFIRPLALRHEKKIDSGLDRAVDAGRAIFDEGELVVNLHCFQILLMIHNLQWWRGKAKHSMCLVYFSP